MLILHILRKAGKKKEDVKSSMNVQRSMELKLLQAGQMNVCGDSIGIVVDKEK